MSRLEQEVNPEAIWGSEPRIPTIMGLGSGHGFEFSNMHLPIGWEKAIPNLLGHTQDHLQQLLGRMCTAQQINPGTVTLDTKTGLVTTLTVGEGVSLSLSEQYMERERGEYHTKNVDNIYEAITLQQFMGLYLSTIGSTIGVNTVDFNPYAYIDGKPGNYYPRDLTLPRKFRNVDKPLTNLNYQEDFAMRASNIAGRFGLTIRTINFNDQGILQWVDVHEGNACSYTLDSHDGHYGEHNVDHPYQAATLQGVVSSFINDVVVRSTQD